MASEGTEARLRLAAAARTEVELRALVDTLLNQGQALFASRSWRIGSSLTRMLAQAARLLGRKPTAPQTARHWQEIVDAHYDALQRRRVLLDQMCADPTHAADVDAALAQLWNRTGEERVLRDAT